MHAVEMYFDDALSQQLVAIAEELASRDIPSPLVGEEPVPPHLSLAVGEDFDRVDFSRLGEALGALPAIQLDAVAMFPTAEGVLFAAPTPGPGLLDVHRRFHEYMHGIPVAINPMYAVGRWFPHATLALGLTTEQLTAALDVVTWHLPVAGRITGVGLAHVESNQVTTLV